MAVGGDHNDWSPVSGPVRRHPACSGILPVNREGGLGDDVGKQFGWDFYRGVRERRDCNVSLVGRRVLRTRLRLNLILLQLAIESGFANSQQACRGQFVAGGFTQRAKNCPPLKFLKRQQFIVLR